MTLDQRRNLLAEAVLYGIVDFGYVSEKDILAVTRGLLDGGADIIQLRAKGIGLETIRAAAEAMIPLCKAAKIPFVLNDFPDLAVELGADGVHIGQDDGKIFEVREQVGEEMLIGRSTHSLEQAEKAMLDGADYIGFGPLFPTPTKAGRPAIGLEEVAKMEAKVGKHLAAFCIGGIKPENLRQIIHAGARRCVVVSYLLTSPDICRATRFIRAELEANP
ncbi:thiamine phosphate synthase [Luteolibacter algae]|uniref:Thiamine-phosphate synthase n=1 Tax=Luteolibacter algae TaxID=454151 RepID=A0ABW5D3K7_9BACT